jgi:hypothetical protein
VGYEDYSKLIADYPARVFSAVVDPSVLIPQTIEGATELKFLIPHMFGGQ